MATRLTGVRFFDLGEEWRKLWTSGTPLKELARMTDQNIQVISRAVWLAKIPPEIKQRIKAYPDIFNRSILLDTFAAKRRQCEANGFALLREEVDRLITLGAGTKPRLKKTNQPRQSKKAFIPTPILKDQSSEVNPKGLTREFALEAQYRLKEALGYSCEVVLSKKGGEVKIFFRDKKGLEGLLETLEPSHSIFS